MADYGLLSGLAEGIKSGVQSYQDTKRYNDEKTRRDRQDQLQQQAFQSGLIGKDQELNPDSGQIQLSEFGKQKQAAEASNYDPNSAKAQFLRNSAEQFGAKNLPQGLLPTDYDKVLPILEKGREFDLRNKELGAKLQATRGDKSAKEAEKLAENFAKDLDPSRARTGEFGKVEARKNAAERAAVLFKQYPDLNIPAIQTRELSTAVGNLLSGGSGGAVTQINELVPSSLQGDANKIASWVTGNPRGLEQQQFIHSLKDTVEREQSLANEQIGKYIRRKTAGYEKLKKTDPEAYNRILQANLVDYGLTPDQLEGLGGPAPQQQRGLMMGQGGGLIPSAQAATPQPHPQDNVAVQWAKSNPNDPRAKAILQANGVR